MRRNWFLALLITLSLLIAQTLPALAGFEGGDSPMWADTGRTNASSTAVDVTHGVDAGGRASDRAVDAAGPNPADHRR